MKYISLILLYHFLVATSFAQPIRKYNKKYFSHNNYFYRFDDTNGSSGVGQLKMVKPNRPFWGSLKEDGNIIIIKPDPVDEQKNGKVVWVEVKSIDFTTAPSGNKVAYIDEIYFPESFFPKNPIKDLASASSKLVARNAKRIKYRDYKFVLQAISVPLKFRKATENLGYATESGTNIAFGGGLKWSYNRYDANKSFLGQKTNSLSFTPGLMFGVGATDIKANITASPTFKDRKEPIFSFGGFFMLGFNNINIGFVIGKDLALKEGRKAGGWVYDSKIWTGISVGLDLIK